MLNTRTNKDPTFRIQEYGILILTLCDGWWCGVLPKDFVRVYDQQHSRVLLDRILQDHNIIIIIIIGVNS
jgi:hypothetical protein